MPQRCGLCIQWALTHWTLPGTDLDRHLCGHHSIDRGDAMVLAGWILDRDDRLEQLHTLPALSADPVTH